MREVNLQRKEIKRKRERENNGEEEEVERKRKLEIIQRKVRKIGV